MPLPDLAEAARQARIEERKAKKRMDEFRKQATEKIAKALKDNQVGAWRLILGKLTYGNLSSKESDLEKIIQRVAGILVGEPYSGEKGLSYLGRVHDTLKFAGLPGIDETEPETKIIDRCICGHTLEEHNPTTGCSECVCEIFEIATTEVVDIPVL